MNSTGLNCVAPLTCWIFFSINALVINDPKLVESEDMEP